MRMLPGIPTIRVFEALACGIPLVCAPWEDTEGLFTPGEDFLVARSGAEMRRHLDAIRADPELRAELSRHGRATIEARHSCAHRVDELLAICSALGRDLCPSQRPLQRNDDRAMSIAHIAFFGSSLVSAYWNGAATYYRGILRALAARGHRITFYEPDAFDRQAHRDIPDPSWASVVVYSVEDPRGVLTCAGQGAGCRSDCQGQRRRRVRHAARGACTDDQAARGARRVLGRRCAGDPRPDCRRPKDPFRALIPLTT